MVEVKIACRRQGWDVASSSVPFLALGSQGLGELGKHANPRLMHPVAWFHAFLVGHSFLHGCVDLCSPVDDADNNG